MNELIANDVKMTSLDLAELTGKLHKNVMADIRKESEELGEEIAQLIFQPGSYIDKNNQERPCYEFGKEGAMQLALKYDAKVRYKVIKKIEELESSKIKPVENIRAFEMHLIGVDYTSRILRVDDTSKIKMLEVAHKHHGVPTDHLPKYIEEEVTKSLTELLKEHEVGLSTAKMNTKLIEFGLLEIKERPSSKGKTKEFKSITEKGLVYGKNLISPNNAKETQPHYYPSKFKELLSVLNITKEQPANSKSL